MLLEFKSIHYLLQKVTVLDGISWLETVSHISRQLGLHPVSKHTTTLQYHDIHFLDRLDHLLQDQCWISTECSALEHKRAAPVGSSFSSKTFLKFLPKAIFSIIPTGSCLRLNGYVTNMTEPILGFSFLSQIIKDSGQAQKKAGLVMKSFINAFLRMLYNLFNPSV